MSYLYLALKATPAVLVDLGYTISFKLTRATVIAVKSIPMSTTATVDTDTYTTMPKYYDLKTRLDAGQKTILESYTPANDWYIGYGASPASSRDGDIATVKVNNESYEMVMGRTASVGSYQWLANLRFLVVP